LSHFNLTSSKTAASVMEAAVLFYVMLGQNVYFVQW